MLYYLGLDGDFVTTFARNLRKGIYPCNSYRDLPHNSSMCDSEATQKIHELNVMHIHVLKKNMPLQTTVSSNNYVNYRL